MNRPVKYARFHSTFFAPGLGNLEAVMPPANKTLKDFSMTALDIGLDVRMNGEECLVPWTNVQMVVFADKAQAADKPVKSKASDKNAA